MIFDDEVLTGVTSEIITEMSKDFNSKEFGQGESVVVIGTAFSGPVGVECPIYNEEHAKYTFGSVYDPITRREASLTAGIIDALRKGAKTVYGMRISGINTFKDFAFARETNLKLRVSGLYPTNTNKDTYFLFDNNTNTMNIKLFKPRTKATIQEKKIGAASLGGLITNYIDLYSNGISKDTLLIDLIKMFNSTSANNVLRLSIVDEKGNDVTLSSSEAKSLKVGDMFPGVYFIGRDKPNSSVIEDTQLSIISNTKPYSTFDGLFFKKLNLNTNINSEYPIYGAQKELARLLGITIVKDYDFITIEGKVDEIFFKDLKDYEEVELSPFEIYKRLGTGYAITASLQKVGNKLFPKETVDEKNRTVFLKDGYYQTLLNSGVKYRVLKCGYADQSIRGKLPKKEEFMVSNAVKADLFGDAASVFAKIDSKDLTNAKKYKLTIGALTTDQTNDLLNMKKSIFDKIAKIATLLKAADKTSVTNRKNGSLALCLDDIVDGQPAITLYKVYDSQFVRVNETALVDKYIYCDSKLYVLKTGTTGVFKEVTSTDITSQCVFVQLENSMLMAGLFKNNICTLMCGANKLFTFTKEDETIVSFSDCYSENKIEIRSNELDYITINDFIEKLLLNKEFDTMFEIEIRDSQLAGEYVGQSLIDNPGYATVSFDDKEIKYDENLYIPYRTDDNFARHLAQHCFHTSIKTAPAHGIIGVSPLLDLSLNSMAKKVEDLKNLRFDSLMTAKTIDGKNILDNEGIPYHIGRKISIYVGQDILTIDNYSYLNSTSSGYAGMVAMLPLDTSSTNQPINMTPMYLFNNTQAEELSNAGFVVPVQNRKKDIVIKDGVTMALPNTEFRRLSTSKSVDFLEGEIKAICEKYIGKQNTPTHQNTLRTELKTFLESQKDLLLDAYSFTLVPDEDTTLCQIDVDYEFYVIGEIQKIANRLKVKRAS